MKAEITVTETGVGSKVLVDGMDVASAIKSLQFSAGLGERPCLYLDGMYLGGAEIAADGVDVDIPERTRKVLIHLGWIPPEIARTYFAPPALPDAGAEPAADPPASG